MSAEIQVEFEGLKKALIALNKVDPELRKEFKQNAQQIGAPVVSAVANAYKFVPLSGMSRAWSGGGNRKRGVFPLDLNKARSGVKVAVQTGYRTTGVIVIQQSNPGWAIFESAGRATVNPLGTALGTLRPGHTRVIGGAVYANKHLIEAEMVQLVKDVVRKIERII
jgi:hypothetical protein